MQLKASEIRELQESIAIDRNEVAYKVLFTQLYQTATHFASLITKNDEVAEELYSDAMMKLWFMRYKLVEIENLKIYLFILIKNAALNYLKKEKKLSFVSIDDIDTANLLEPSSVEQTLAYHELNALLKRAIDSLPPKCLMVYKLIKEDGFSYKQAAEILNLSVNTIEGHMQNALQKLAQYLKRANLEN